MWYLKQLFPLTYRTKYNDSGGNAHFCVWNMWLGKCYNVEDYILEK